MVRICRDYLGRVGLTGLSAESVNNCWWCHRCVLIGMQFRGTEIKPLSLTSGILILRLVIIYYNTVTFFALHE